MYKRTVILILCVGLVFLAGYYSVIAEEDSEEQTSTITLIIQPACNLSITDSAVSAAIVKDSTAEGAFDDGYVELDADKPTLTINSNSSWNLSAKASGFSGPYSKDVNDLQLKDSAIEHVNAEFSNFNSLSTADKEVASYNNGVRGEEHPLQYKIILDWEKDVPGTYEATVTYTLSTSAS